MGEPPKKPKSKSDDDIPALFATIHFRTEHRPDGYTAGDIEELNRLANSKPRTDRQTESEDD